MVILGSILARIMIQKSSDTRIGRIFDSGWMRKNAFGFVDNEIIGMYEHHRNINIWSINQKAWVKIPFFLDNGDNIVRIYLNRSFTTISPIDADQPFGDEITSKRNTQRLILTNDHVEPTIFRGRKHRIHSKKKCKEFTIFFLENDKSEFIGVYYYNL